MYKTVSKQNKNGGEMTVTFEKRIAENVNIFAGNWPISNRILDTKNQTGVPKNGKLTL
jgi:hypothetical protein